MTRYLATLFVLCVLLIQTAYAQKADEYFNKKEYGIAIQFYENEVKTNNQGYLNLAKSYFATQQFDKAIEAMRNYRDKYSGADKAYCDKFIQLLERNDEPITINNMGPVINVSKPDYYPVVTNDGKTLFFVSNGRDGGKGGEDIWYVERKEDGTWGEPKNFSVLNTTTHENLLSMSSDGNAVVLFGNYAGTFGAGDLFYSVKTENGWTVPCNMGGTINTQHWEAQANLGVDGRTLLFCSNRPGGVGNSDIYVSQLTETGWTKPINLGSIINTSENETGPMLAADGKTLYFNSYGHFGFGEADIFMTKRLDDTWTNWSTPVNLGKYVNSLQSDQYLTIPSSGVHAYTVRNDAADGQGDTDLYDFILPPGMRPEQAFNVWGVITNEKDSVTQAMIRYFDVETGKEVAKAVSNVADGVYRVSLPAYRKYETVIDMKGYLYYSDILDLTDPSKYMEKTTIQDKLRKEMANLQLEKQRFDEYSKEFEKLLASNSENISEAFAEFQKLSDKYKANAAALDASIKKARYDWLSEEKQFTARKDYQIRRILIGAKFELKNISFDFGKATLKEESKTELNKLFDIMKRSQIVIELGGHTDNVGSDESNLNLSQERVNSVRKYLLDKGIPEIRIAAVGYGETQPIATNDTDEGRSLNRRVEVKITELRPREGSGGIVQVEEPKPMEKFNFQQLLLAAAKAGGLPQGSECSDEPIRDVATVTVVDTPQKEKRARKSVDEIDLENYIYKKFNAHVLNYSTESTGAGVTLVKDAPSLREIHLRYFFVHPDGTDLGFGGGLLWSLQLAEVINQPINLIYGIDYNYFKFSSGETQNQLTVPLGLRYIKNISGLVIGPELSYNIGLTGFKGYPKIGLNARWKMIQGGVFATPNAPSELGFRAGVAF